MNSPCIHCGVPVPYFSAGFVTVASSRQDSLTAFQPMAIQGNKAIFQYGSLKEAEDLVETFSSLGIPNMKIGVSDKAGEARLFNPELMKIRLQERETVEFIQHGEMTSYLQPILNLRTKEVYGYESLLRAKNPDEFISPAKIFQTAARTELSSLLDQRARESAIQVRKGTVSEGIKSFINFLPSTIYNPDFCLKHTFEIVEKYQVNPEDLVFEVVETEKIIDVPHLKRVLDRYRKEGMKVALDDVGAGFATIDMLSLLQPDYVKIDRSYISDCHLHPEKQEFLAETLKHAHGLGILALAEGIETAAELKICADLGYDFAQGYYFGKPLPATEAVKAASAV